MRQAYILRGLPGSGKTHLATLLAGDNVASADDYFTDAKGNYNFDAKLLPAAHKACMNKWTDLMTAGEETIAVANTFSQRWEWLPYFDVVREFGYNVTVIDLFDNNLADWALAERNIHRVPKEVIARMRARWEK